MLRSSSASVVPPPARPATVASLGATVMLLTAVAGSSISSCANPRSGRAEASSSLDGGPGHGGSGGSARPTTTSASGVGGDADSPQRPAGQDGSGLNLPDSSVGNIASDGSFNGLDAFQSNDASDDVSSDAAATDVMPDAEAAQCANRWPPTAEPVVTETFVAQNPPVGAGGSLRPGLYLLTEWIVYTGVDGGLGTGSNVYMAVDVALEGNTARVESVTAFNVATFAIWNDWVWTTSGNRLTQLALCFDGADSTELTFTATQDELRLYSNNEEFVFARGS